MLLFSAFLAALAAAAMRTGLSGARAAAVFADGVRADALGRGAADALAFRLATGDAAARRGGAIGLRLPGADVTVDYLSESARVDANAAPVPLIAALLAAAGAEPAEAEAAAARVARFRADAAARAKAGPAPRPAAPASRTAPPAGGGLAALRAAVDALGPAAKPKPRRGPGRDPRPVRGRGGLGPVRRAGAPRPAVAHREQRLRHRRPGAGGPHGAAGAARRRRARRRLHARRRRQGFVDKDSALALLPVPSRDFAGFDDVPAVRAVARVRVANRYERRYEIVLAPPAPPSRVPAGRGRRTRPPPCRGRPGTAGGRAGGGVLAGDAVMVRPC